MSVLGMNFCEVDEREVDRYIHDTSWVMQQKHDGTRVLAVIDSGGVRYFQRGGKALAHTAATQHLAALTQALEPLVMPGSADAVVLDGEIIIGTGHYYVFDVPDGGALPMGATVAQRLEVLAHLDNHWASFPITPVRAVRTARTAQDKAEMFERARRAGVEGVMVKRLDSPYEPGKRVKHSLKIKFVKTADVVVTNVNRGRNEAGREIGSIEFGIPTAGEVTVLGTCSVIGKEHVEPGDVIEVAYLYRADTGGLVQPRMVRRREDKPGSDCNWDQFPLYSREVI